MYPAIENWKQPTHENFILCMIYMYMYLQAFEELSIILESFDSHVEIFRTVGKFSTYMYRAI